MGVGGRNQFGKVGCGENHMAKAVLGRAVRGKLDLWSTLFLTTKVSNFSVRSLTFRFWVKEVIA